MTADQESRIRRQKRFGRTARYAGTCTDCRSWITAQTRKQWQRARREPCPHCGQRGW